MAISPQICIQYEADGSKIIVKGDTGAYTVNNEEGLGAPNNERSDLAAVLIVNYQPYEGALKLLTITTETYIEYDANNTNTDEPTFELDYFKDGWYNYVYAFVPTLASGLVTPEEGSIVYNTTSGELEIYNSGLTLEPLTDINKVNDPLLYALVETDQLACVNLKAKSGQLGRDYIGCSACSECNCEDEFKQHIYLKEGIRVALSQFKISKYEAQRVVERLTAKYNIK